MEGVAITLRAGQSKWVSLMPMDEHGNVSGTMASPAVNWSTSDPSILTVQQDQTNGFRAKVTAVGKTGKAQVLATLTYKDARQPVTEGNWVQVVAAEPKIVQMAWETE